MLPDEMDAARLWDMLTHAEEVCQSLHGVTLEQYLRDKDRRMATERRIVGLPHVLAHEYGEIKQETIFQLVSQHLPSLVAALRPLVPPPPEDEP